MREIHVQRLNNNENVYLIGKYYISEGDYIKSGARIAEIESSKTIEDIVSDSEGYIHLLFDEGNEIEVLSSFALVFSTIEEYESYVKNDDSEESSEQTDYHLTQKAQELVRKYAISDEDLRSIGKSIIKTSDLDSVIQRYKNKIPKDETIIKLSNNQRQVGKVVTKSHNEIPQAFLVEKIDVSDCISFFEDYYENTGVVIGFGELLVEILFKIKNENPVFFGTLTDDGHVRVTNSVGIGVTFDLGNGLFIPVVKQKNGCSLNSIAEELYEYKLKAASGKYESEDFQGANLCISLNTIGNVIYSIPIIPPGQLAMISVGAPVEECVYENNKVVTKHFLYVGLAYDHRVINGFAAMDFIKKIEGMIKSYDLPSGKI